MQYIISHDDRLNCFVVELTKEVKRSINLQHVAIHLKVIVKT